VFAVADASKIPEDVLAKNSKYFSLAYLKDKHFVDSRFTIVKNLLRRKTQPMLQLAKELVDDLWNEIEMKRGAYVDTFKESVRAFFDADEVAKLKECGVSAEMPRIMARVNK
jgi:hypothetical protein